MENPKRKITRPFGIMTAKKTTVVMASDYKDAVIRYLKSYSNLREALVDGEFGGGAKISYESSGQAKEILIPLLPLLIVLNALSETEGIQYLVSNDRLSEDVAQAVIKNETQKAQWIVGKV